MTAKRRTKAKEELKNSRWNRRDLKKFILPKSELCALIVKNNYKKNLRAAMLFQISAYIYL